MLARTTLRTRLTFAMVALVLLTAAAVGILTYGNVEGTVLAGEIERAEFDARLLAAELEAYVRSARGDALGFRSAVALSGIVRATLAGGTDPAEGVTTDQWRARLATRFVAELAAKPAYVQFRVIGVADGGRELVRVDRSGADKSARIMPDSELQARGDRDDVRQALRLAPGEVHVSRIGLNQEDGVIETPYVPVLRVATAIHTPAGETFGVLIITVDLRPAFDLVRSTAKPGRQVFVVNERGDFLVHPQPGREFGFEFAAPTRWQDEFPEFAEALGAAQRGAAVVHTARGDRIGAALASARLADGPRIAVIETLAYAELMAPAHAIARSILLIGLIAVLLAIGFAIVIARSLTRPLAQMSKSVNAFAEGKPMSVPVGTGGEIGTLARAFSRMAEEVQEKTAALTHEIEERHRIFETTLDLILVVDRRGTILRVSPSSNAIVGYAPEEMIGRGAINFIYPDDLDTTREEMRQARRGHLMRNFQCRYVHRDGHPVPLAWTGIWSELDQRHFFIGRDMTEHTQLEQQLRHAQKLDAIGQLTGGVAHDFNNMLTVILGTVGILADAVADKPQLAAIAKMIDQAAERGADLTAQLLAFARKQPLQPAPTDVRTMITDVDRLLRPALGENVQIETALKDDTWPAMVDVSQLSTALINLAINARDAMTNGGKITIEAGNVVLDEAYTRANADVRPGPYVMIAVSDTGTGIPAAIRDRVFEPFFTTKGPGQGTGLGLSMVYGFIKQSNGHIKIYSEEGHGTAIKIYLPCASEPANIEDVAVVDEQLVGGSDTILLVEDDGLVRDYVTGQLNSLGYTVLAAADAAEGLKLIDGGAEFDLLLTDVILSGRLTGKQLADAVSKLRPATKILYTSGYTENAIIHHGRLDPGVLLLPKPYRKADLARMVRVALGDAVAKPAADHRLAERRAG